jgi:hypothetical protein
MRNSKFELQAQVSNWRLPKNVAERVKMENPTTTNLR